MRIGSTQRDVLCPSVRCSCGGAGQAPDPGAGHSTCHTARTTHARGGDLASCCQFSSSNQHKVSCEHRTLLYTHLVLGLLEQWQHGTNGPAPACVVLMVGQVKCKRQLQAVGWHSTVTPQEQHTFGRGVCPLMPALKQQLASSCMAIKPPHTSCPRTRHALRPAWGLA